MKGKRVVVVGGGLAGLTAAVDLLETGCEVTVIEAAERCGGKLSSWRDGDGRRVEHGMHGWWPNYRNFFALMARVGIERTEVLRKAQRSDVVHYCGRQDVVRPVSGAFPLFLWRLVRQAGVRWSDLWRLLRVGIGVLAFRASHDFSSLDDMSFGKWLECRGVGAELRQRFFEPYVRSFAFDSSDRISAAAVLSSYHFYLVRRAGDSVPSWLVGDPGECIIEPIVRYIRMRGGRVSCGNRVTGLAVDRGRVTAVHAGRLVRHPKQGMRAGRGEAERVEIARLRMADLPEEGFVRDRRTGEVFVGRIEIGGKPVALLGICTHQNGAVRWCGKESRFVCREHGARFGADGEVCSGMAKRPLVRYEVEEIEEDGERVVVVWGRRVRIEGDSVILAVDVENCKKLIPGNVRDGQLYGNIGCLGTTPVLVARLWFNGQRLLGKRTAGVFVGYPLLDNFFVVSNIQEYYEGKGETVIEVQAYLVDDKVDWSKAKLCSAVMRDLKSAFGLCWHQMKGEPYIEVYSSFAHHNPGSNVFRPGTCTKVQGLYCAGDWVTKSPEMWHMERAVVSGRLAAGVVGRCVERDILGLQSGGWLFRMCAWGARGMASLRARWCG